MTGNPRRGDVEAVAKSLKRLGQHRPIVVQRSTGEILVGNHTYLAAVSLGWDEIAVLFTDDDRETAVARALADNRTHEAGTYDSTELAAMIAEIGEADRSLLDDAGFARDEIEALLAVAGASVEPDVDDNSKHQPPVAPNDQVSHHDEAPADDIDVERVEPRQRQESQFDPYDGEAGDSRLFVGHCLDVLAEFPDKCVDSVITDPLGGVSTERTTKDDLGEGWWGSVPGPDFWREILRVMKPGAHCAVIADTTNFHRVAIAAEEAGLEMRDTLVWLYGHGQAMGVDVGMKVDKRMGGDGRPYFKTISGMTDSQREEFIASRSDNRWDGWSSALKPAWKPILLLRRKPTAGSIASSVIAHGTGAINIDGCRIDSEERQASVYWINTRESKIEGHGNEIIKTRVATGKTTLGRWPSNVVVDEEVYVDLGTSARYFLCASARRSERDAGLPAGRANDHPKVRPADLMRWLVRLLTPPGGVVLDPFCGSGSTGVAATSEGMGFVGIDRNERWITDIARFRLADAKARVAQKKTASG